MQGNKEDNKIDSEVGIMTLSLKLGLSMFQKVKRLILGIWDLIATVKTRIIAWQILLSIGPMRIMSRAMKRSKVIEKILTNTTTASITKIERSEDKKIKYLIDSERLITSVKDQ